MRLWTAMKQLLGPRPIATRQELKQFLESRAAYLVQKSIMEYSQARANMLFSTLLGESAFLSAYDHARWHSYPAAFSMVAEMAEGHLRGHAGAGVARFQAALAAIGGEVFQAFPPPAGAPADFWRAAGEALDRDLAAAALAAPKPVNRIPRAREGEIFAVLPVHESLRRHDRDMFHNTLKLHLAEIGGEFAERAEAAKLAAALAH